MDRSDAPLDLVIVRIEPAGEPWRELLPFVARLARSE